MYILSFTKSVANTNKLDLELRILNSKYNSLVLKGDALQLIFDSSLTQAEVDAVSNKINTFVETDISVELQTYIEKEVRPFIDKMMYQIKAENILMGVTQYGKTVDVLGFFNEKITLPTKTRAVSIKDALSDDSLYAVVDLLNYYLDNPSLYSDLSPFVTGDRITQWKNKIVEFLT
jgi:hypothetical protein